jgi:hypothetical protein
MNRKYFVRSFRPTFVFVVVSVGGIIIISHSLRFILPVPVQEMSALVFISIFLMECYIIPLSYLSKLYTALKNTKKIVQLHLGGLAVPLMLAIVSGSFFNEKVFLCFLLSGSAIIFINYYCDYKKIQRVI